MNPIRRELLRRRRLHRSGEFEFARAYVPGDDASRIDWRLTARTGAIHVRERSRDVPLCWSELIDRSRSMLAGRVRSLARSAAKAAELWRGALSADDRFIELRPTQSFPLSLENAADLPLGTCVLVIGDFLDVDNIADILMPLTRRLDCTVLMARDPWHADLPLYGFVRVADLETKRAQEYCIGAGERARYRRYVAIRETQVFSELRRAGCRVGQLDEADGALSLRRVFGFA